MNFPTNISQLLINAYFGDQDSILVLGDYCEENNIYFQGLINADVEELFINYHTNYGVDNGGYGDGDGNSYGYGDGDGNSLGYDVGLDNGYDNSNGNNFDSLNGDGFSYSNEGLV